MRQKHSKGTISYHKPLIDMSPAEVIEYLEQLKARLQRKQRRERTYLDRRARRGIQTPTDETYEADQVLEDELLAVLDDLLEGAHAQGSAP